MAEQRGLNGGGYSYGGPQSNQRPSAPTYHGNSVEMNQFNQFQPERNHHGGGYVPPQPQQTYPDRPHGGSYVPPQPQQTHLDRPHGGSYVPPQQTHLDRPHGGAYVPPQPQQPSSNKNHGGAYVPVQQPQQQQPYGQLQGELQGAAIDQGNTHPVSGGPGVLQRGISSNSQILKLHSSERDKSDDKDPQVPRKPQRGYRNIFNDRNSWRWKYPNAYQLPGLKFTSLLQFHHRDIMQREKFESEEDRYLSPYDGHLAKLVVQAADEVYDASAQSTWRRTFVRNVSSFILRVANWAVNSVPANPSQWGFEDWVTVIGKWIGAIFVLLLLMSYPSSVNGEVRNNGWYDAFPYRFWGYPKYARNAYEDHPSQPKKDNGRERAPVHEKEEEISLGQEPYEVEQGTNPVTERLLRPRYLCFLNKPESKEIHGVVPMKVKDWLAQNNLATHPDYLFVAYTAEQFHGDQDLRALAELAERATRNAGLTAYWIGSSCMADEQEMEQDVYRISDVIRGASALAIIVGHPVKNRETIGAVSTEQMLQQWGRRMWTLPEALLSPAGLPIQVYTRGLDGGEPMAIEKRKFAGLAWSDAPSTRQLMDHYEGSMILSTLELVVLALRCLNTRDIDRNTHFPGDLSYVLMGLLRRRPRVNPDDTAFQAFGRLSLANDSNMLLERLVCVHPKSLDQTWLNTEDAWGAKLWDIYPTCQVAGVANDDTVILDGAFGANIRWKAFAPVAYLARDSWKRLGARTLLRFSPIVFFTSIIFLALPGSMYKGIGALLFLISLLTLIASPKLVRVLYTGKLWGTQAWFFGFEGYMDIHTIESNIFGASMGRLTWSPSASPLSRHRKNRQGECRGIDPTTDESVRKIVERAKHAPFGQQKVFTLVDTNTLQVTMFAAVRPPVAVLLCGYEGGMQRAVMCSYESKTQTLYRESVLRMETPVLQKMFRVGRFRFGFRRPVGETRMYH